MSTLETTYGEIPVQESNRSHPKSPEGAERAEPLANRLTLEYWQLQDLISNISHRVALALSHLQQKIQKAQLNPVIVAEPSAVATDKVEGVATPTVVETIAPPVESHSQPVERAELTPANLQQQIRIENRWNATGMLPVSQNPQKSSWWANLKNIGYTTHITTYADSEVKRLQALDISEQVAQRITNLATLIQDLCMIAPNPLWKKEFATVVPQPEPLITKYIETCIALIHKYHEYLTPTLYRQIITAAEEYSGQFRDPAVANRLLQTIQQFATKPAIQKESLSSQRTEKAQYRLEKCRDNDAIIALVRANLDDWELCQLACDRILQASYFSKTEIEEQTAAAYFKALSAQQTNQKNATGLMAEAEEWLTKAIDYGSHHNYLMVDLARRLLELIAPEATVENNGDHLTITDCPWENLVKKFKQINGLNTMVLGLLVEKEMKNTEQSLGQQEQRYVADEADTPADPVVIAEGGPADSTQEPDDRPDDNIPPAQKPDTQKPAESEKPTA